jgi:hypothetical protein
VLLPEPVVGFRAWRVRPDGGLAPKVASAPWSSNEPTAAHCWPPPHAGHARRGPHAAPHRACHCGIHAYHSIELMRPEKTPFTNFVYGAVVAAGRIVVSREGFRAERARVVAVSYNPLSADRPEAMARLERVARGYRIPLVPQEDLEAYARTFGRPYDPATLEHELPV